ncbi:hypothetical protein MMC13_000365, partial [Lambiella insularis]|nr:hypothetical protein [Lambiella insularis]
MRSSSRFEFMSFHFLRSGDWRRLYGNLLRVLIRHIYQPPLESEPQITPVLQQPRELIFPRIWTRNPYPPDSGYASMSASGNASITQSYHVDALQSVALQKQNINSYPYHIPEQILRT